MADDPALRGQEAFLQSPERLLFLFQRSQSLQILRELRRVDRIQLSDERCRRSRGGP